MNRQELIKTIAEAGDIEPTNSRVARYLGITSETVRGWDEYITYKVLRNVAGDFVRIGVRVPKKIVDEMRKKH